MQNKINNLLKERYYLPTEDSWEQLATRVSAIYPPILEDIKNKAFLPSTPTLMNANTDGQKKGTLSSCFTMGIEDSIEGIFDSLKEGAVVTKSSGGVGYDFTVLRSDKEGIKSLYDRPSSGPIPFMLMFNQMLDGIQQGGVRRGAGMGMLRCFSNTTEVLTKDGWKNILLVISDLEEGKEVYICDENGEYWMAKNPIVTEPEEVYTIELEDGTVIETTKDHKFEVKNIETGEVSLKPLYEIDFDKEEFKIIVEN